MKTSHIPENSHSVNVYLIIKDAAKAIEFYKKAFGAKEVGRLSMPDGTIGHAELLIGDSSIMLSEVNPQWGHKDPLGLGGTPVMVSIYVENVDEVFNNAVSAGGRVDQGMEVKDQFYGDRSGSIIDPFGHRWTIATHIEDVSFDEMQKRMEKEMAN